MSDKLSPAGPPLRVLGEVQLDAPIIPGVLEKRFTGNVIKSSLTPSVKNVENWIAKNTGAVTVTNFLDGQEGQRLYILGDGFTTLQHGTKIFMQGGANLLLASSKAYMFVRLSSAWYQI